MSDGGAQFYSILAIDTNGDPSPLAKLYHYDAGTTNLKNIWSNEDKTGALAQPFISDSAGRFVFYGDGDYKFKIDTAGDVTLNTWDNVNVTSETAKIIDFGTVSPTAATANKGHLFALLDGSNNFLKLRFNTNNSWFDLLDFTTSGAPIFDSVITKTMPVYNVLHADWGAVGDGSTDDTAAIQAAIDAIEAANGGVLYFPQATYKIDGTLDINNTNIVVMGDGTGMSIIKQINTAGAVDYDTNDVKDKFIWVGVDLLTDQVGAGTAIDCLWPSTLNSLEHQNCMIKDCTIGPTRTDSATAYFSDCIKLSDAKKPYLNNILLRGNDNNVTNGTGLTLQGQCSNAKLDAIGVRFLNTGIDILGTSTAITMSNSNVVNCNFGVDFSVSTSNHFFDNVNFEAIYNKCISVTTGTPSIVTVSDCKFSKSASSTEDWRGIDGDYSTYNFHDNVFVDNGSASGTDVGIKLGTVTNGSISGNVIKDIDTGISVAATAVDTNMTCNTIDGSTTGIFLAANTADFIIEANRIIDATTGVTVSAGTSNNFAISGNNFQGCTTNVSNSGTGVQIQLIGNVPPEDGLVIASAATITLAPYGNLFTIAGTTNITSITASWVGRVAILVFAAGAALTVTDGSNLFLAGNFVATPDDTITLVCNGTNWYEMARSVN